MENRDYLAMKDTPEPARRNSDDANVIIRSDKFSIFLESHSIRWRLNFNDAQHMRRVVIA